MSTAAIRWAISAPTVQRKVAPEACWMGRCGIIEHHHHEQKQHHHRTEVDEHKHDGQELALSAVPYVPAARENASMRYSARMHRIEQR